MAKRDRVRNAERWPTTYHSPFALAVAKAFRIGCLGANMGTRRPRKLCSYRMSLISSNVNRADSDTSGHVFWAREWGGDPAPRSGETACASRALRRYADSFWGQGDLEYIANECGIVVPCSQQEDQTYE